MKINQLRVDEGGELSRSKDVIKLFIQQSITLQTTGGYNSWLNGKIELPHHTLTNMFNSALKDSGHDKINGYFHVKKHKKYIMD